MRLLTQTSGWIKQLHNPEEIFSAKKTQKTDKGKKSWTKYCGNFSGLKVLRKKYNYDVSITVIPSSKSFRNIWQFYIIQIWMKFEIGLPLTNLSPVLHSIINQSINYYHKFIDLFLYEKNSGLKRVKSN